MNIEAVRPGSNILYETMQKSTVRLDQAGAEDSVSISPAGRALFESSNTFSLSSGEVQNLPKQVAKLKMEPAGRLSEEELQAMAERSNGVIKELQEREAAMQARHDEIYAKNKDIIERRRPTVVEEGLAKEQALGIDGSALDSPLKTTTSYTHSLGFADSSNPDKFTVFSFQEKTVELASPVSVNTRSGNQINLFTENDAEGRQNLIASVTYQDGTVSRHAISGNTVFSEDENGKVNIFEFAGEYVQGTENDDIIINLSGYYVEGGAGDDTIINLNARAEEISGGDGNDTIYTGEIDHGQAVRGGAGNDKIYASYAAVGAEIDTGEGDNLVQVRHLNASIRTGNGNNTIRAAIASYAGHTDKPFEIATGAGNDTIELGYVGGHSHGEANIAAGEGNNTIKIGTADVTWLNVTAGDGDNRLEIGTTAKAINNITMGNGNNSLLIDNLRGGSDISLGDGNNDLKINNQTERGTLMLEGLNEWMIPRMKHEFRFGHGNNNVSVNKLFEARIVFGQGNNTLSAESLDYSIIKSAEADPHAKQGWITVPKGKGILPFEQNQEIIEAGEANSSTLDNA